MKHISEILTPIIKRLNRPNLQNKVGRFNEKENFNKPLTNALPTYKLRIYDKDNKK